MLITLGFCTRVLVEVVQFIKECVSVCVCMCVMWRSTVDLLAHVSVSLGPDQRTGLDPASEVMADH